jgi:hypothetical protein
LPRAGWSPPDFPPSSAAPLHCPCGGVVRLHVAAAGGGRLLRTRGDRLSRRGMGSRRSVRPDRLGRPCRFRLPIERREAGGEMAGNGSFGHVAELLHAGSHIAATLTTRSTEAASTLKIVRICRRYHQSVFQRSGNRFASRKRIKTKIWSPFRFWTMRPPMAWRPHREG